MRERPADLPDYSNPPLDEVVVGVQFDPPPMYTSVLAQDVWKLFSDEFPKVQELPRLSPQFEVFGRQGGRTGPQFEFGHGPIRGRLWFVSQNDSHLIQFQDDRLLMNWRRRPTGGEYPHFEGIAAQFERHLSTLKEYFDSQLLWRLSINQAEVTYINLMPVAQYNEIGGWLRSIHVDELDIEGLNLNFPELIRGTDGKPVARLHHEVSTLVSNDGKRRLLRYGLTFRGKPETNTISSAIELILNGRRRIVHRFNDTTTDSAHQKWEKIK